MKKRNKILNTDSFAGRLQNIMEIKKYARPRDLAKNMLIKTDDPGTNKDTENALEKKIKANLKDNSNPTYTTIKEYCDFFKCQPDYFFSYQNVPNRDIHKAHEEIGLKYESIEAIKNYPVEIKELLDHLILNDGDNLLKLLNAMETYALKAHHSIVRLEVHGNDSQGTQIDIEDELIGATPDEGNRLYDISKQMLKYSAISVFDNILTKTYNQYIDKGNDLFKRRLEKKGEIKKKRIAKLISDRTWRELTVEEFVSLYEYANMTESEISNKIDSEMIENYNRYKETLTPPKTPGNEKLKGNK